MVTNYVKRGEWYHYNRRVPKNVSEYDRRSHVRIALKTKQEKEAAKIAAIYDDFIEKYWSDLIRLGQRDENLDLFTQARSVARSHGFAYKNLAEVASAPLDEVLMRIHAVSDDPQNKKHGLLGRASSPGIKLTDCEERFWPLIADRLVQKTSNQVRKYRNPRLLALKNLVRVVGDVDLATFERSHVLEFRKWLMEQIGKGELKGDSANKQIRHAKDILHTVAIDAQIDTDFPLLFSGLRFQVDEDSRPPFEASYIQQKYLNGSSLAGLNHDARMLVYLMIETGARETELIGLDKDDFFLEPEDGGQEEAHIPHIWIRKNRIRGLKTKHSNRKIPLVGVALEAAKQIYPHGIKRYQKNPDSASTLINDFLLSNNLRPTREHTLYSIRHTFKDRLRDVEVPAEIIDELMGHKKKGPQYGRGHTLAAKQKWLKRIAFDPPKAL